MKNKEQMHRNSIFTFSQPDLKQKTPTVFTIGVNVKYSTYKISHLSRPELALPLHHDPRLDLHLDLS